jgi:hypothetical protein
MNKKIKNSDSSEPNKNGALDKISAKSNSLKAALKSKYLISKIEKSFFNNY